MQDDRERRDDGAHAVHVQERGVEDTLEVQRARERFGGFDVPATLAGALVAIAMTVLLGGILGAAIGGFGYQWGLEVDGIEQELSVGGIVAGILVLFLAFLAGGWSAARMARFDGGRNGLMTAVWVLLLAAILGGLGAWLGSEYDVFAEVDLPQWFSDDALTGAAIASGIASAVAMLLGGLLGGRIGERYNRLADAAMLSVRRGGLTQEPLVRRVRGSEHVR